jgi:N-acetylneuraminic acid mutarotase
MGGVSWARAWACAVAVGCVLAASAASTAFAKPKAGTWTSLAPVPAPTEGMSTANQGNLIVAAYGYSGGDTNTTRIYNIAANSWSFGSPAPPPASSEGIAVNHGNSIYALGGRGGAGNDNNRYTPSSDTWTVLPPMLTPRDGLGAAVIGNSIYAIGGRPETDGPCSGFIVFANVERFDIATNTWSTVAPLPTARSDIGAIEHGGKIYVFGGCTGSGAATVTNEVDIYDPTTDTWTEGAPMPTARAAFYGIGIKGDGIYVMGGIDASGAQSPANEVYNIALNSWSTATPMPDPRAEMGVASHGGRIYTVGGGHPGFGASVATNEAFKP